MNSEDEEDFFDGEEVDEHEYEISTPGGRTINWRRIEMLKEQMWLKEQTEDFGDW